jgi:hypothetical protein
MKSEVISTNIAEFKATKNPKYFIKAVMLLIKQGRVHEYLYGTYTKVFFKPSEVNVNEYKETEITQKIIELLLSSKELLFRDELIKMYGEDFMVEKLPEDFIGARLETVICKDDYLIIGEYSQQGKRIAYIDRENCFMNEYYNQDSTVRHIHAIYKSPDSDDLIVTVGDTAKYLDLWSITDSGVEFKERKKKYLAGHTAIVKLGGEYYCGSDFSSRPNYIESFDANYKGEKYFFPKKANRKFVLRFLPYLDRYIFSLNTEITSLGGRYTVSVFDTKLREYVYCEDQEEYEQPKELDIELNKKAIKMRSSTPSELEY